MKVNTICQAAAVAAIYVVLSLIFMPISFGPVQCRISEMLTVLPAFMPAAVPGLAIGCLITNILGGAILPDIIFGTIATLIGAVFTYILTKKARVNINKNINKQSSGNIPLRFSLSFRLSAVLPPVISNTIIVPLVLRYAYVYDEALYFMAFTVGLGELISAGILGNLLINVLGRSKICGAFSSFFQYR